MNYICLKCDSIYMREEDARDCFMREVENPLINVGTVLISDSYGEENEIRCYGITRSGHDISYRFEWKSPDSGDWEHVYAVHSNWDMIESFGEQIYAYGIKERDNT